MRVQSISGGKLLWNGHRLLRLRGKGSFGEVWEAETPAGERVALKFLRCTDDLRSSHELRSIQTVRQLPHPNLVRVDHVLCDRGYLVVIMELGEGSLADLLELSREEYGTPLPPEVVCQYLTDAARALDFLNAHNHHLGGPRVGIQHCDIKPSNLLLVGDTVKLCDFSLASTLASATVEHRRAGTVPYAAPEVHQGRLTDWTDQYALAVSYVELRTGRLPFPQGPSRFRKNYVRPVPNLDMLPRAEGDVIARALSRTPQDRWPSCGDMMDRLTRLVTAQPAEAAVG